MYYSKRSPLVTSSSRRHTPTRARRGCARLNARGVSCVARRSRIGRASSRSIAVDFALVPMPAPAVPERSKRRGKKPPSSTLTLPRSTELAAKLPLPKWLSMPNAVIASCAAVLVTNPMDRAKTLMQLPGASAAWGQNMSEVMINRVRKEGLFRGPYRGLPVALVRESSKNVFRIGLFPAVLRALHGDDETPAPTWTRFVAGCISGAVGAVSSNPFDLIKTRMQVPAKMCDYANGVMAFKTICKQEGWRTLYKGVGASVARDMLGSSVNLTVQSIASEALVRNMILSPGSPVLGALSGVLSAAASVAVMQPIDTSRAYVYLKPHLHKNSIRAFRYIVLREGPLALYKGSRAHFLRTAPHYAAMFSLLEMITGGERRWLLERNKAVLANVPLFDALSSARRARLAHMVKTKKFKTGEEIISEGECPDEMYIVTKGCAKIDQLRAKTKTKTKTKVGSSNGSAYDYDSDLINRNGYFGESSLFGNPSSSEKVTAVNDVTVMVVPRQAFEDCRRFGDDDDGPFGARSLDLDPTKELDMAWKRLRYERTLARIPAFAALGAYERAMVVKQAKRYSFKKNEKVMRKGEKGDDKFFVVLKGYAVSTKADNDIDKVGLGESLPQDRVLRTFGPGGYFGELALLTGAPRLNTVVARESLDVLAIDRDVLRSLREHLPTLEDEIIRNLRRFDHVDSFTTMSIA